jgi:hypothetical protein
MDNRTLHVQSPSPAIFFGLGLGPKPEKGPIFPQNRRPIRLLSGLEKLFKKLILQRLLKIVQENELIPEELFGFSRGCSASHQILRSTEYVTTDSITKRVLSMYS